MVKVLSECARGQGTRALQNTHQWCTLVRVEALDCRGRVGRRRIPVGVSPGRNA